MDLLERKLKLTVFNFGSIHAILVNSMEFTKLFDSSITDPSRFFERLILKKLRESSCAFAFESRRRDFYSVYFEIRIGIIRLSLAETRGGVNISKIKVLVGTCSEKWPSDFDRLGLFSAITELKPNVGYL